MAESDDDNSRGPPADPIDTDLYNSLVSSGAGTVALSLDQTLDSVLQESGYESPDEDADSDSDSDDEEGDEGDKREVPVAHQQRLQQLRQRLQQLRQQRHQLRRELRRRAAAQELMRPFVRALVRGLRENPRVVRKLTIRSKFFLLIADDLEEAFWEALARLSELEHFEVYAEEGEGGVPVAVSMLPAVVRSARGLKVFEVMFPEFNSQSDVESLALALDTQADSLDTFNLATIYFDGDDTVPEGFSLDPIVRSLSAMSCLKTFIYSFHRDSEKALTGQECVSDEAFSALCTSSSLQFLFAQEFCFGDRKCAALAGLIAGTVLRRVYINSILRWKDKVKVSKEAEAALLSKFEDNYCMVEACLGIVSEDAQERIRTFLRLNAAGRGDLLTTDRCKLKTECVEFLISISDHPIDDIFCMLKKLDPTIWAPPYTTDDQRAHGARARRDAVK